MPHIHHTITTDLMTWDHGTGVCKLIRMPRPDIDEGSDEPDAWNLIWVEASTNIRRTDIVLDPTPGRELTTYERETVRGYAETAPPEAVEVLAEFLG